MYFFNQSMDSNCNLNHANTNTHVIDYNDSLYSGFVLTENDISCFGDVLTTACYVDTHNVLYDGCKFATPLSDTAVCSFRPVYSISPCMALDCKKFKMGDNVGILCNIIANCKNNTLPAQIVRNLKYM
jgi:hypothetical protein